MIPTKRIEESDFRELTKHFGSDPLPIFKVVALKFEPPLPEGEEPPGYASKKPVMRLIPLNVTEPRIYTNKQGDVHIIYPMYDELTYELLQDMHPVKGAWCYRWSHLYWVEADHSSNLDEALYFFKPDYIPPFAAYDVTTH